MMTPELLDTGISLRSWVWSHALSMPWCHVGARFSYSPVTNFWLDFCGNEIQVREMHETLMLISQVPCQGGHRARLGCTADCVYAKQDTLFGLKFDLLLWIPGLIWNLIY